MFKTANPYEEIVNNTTDENLTAENWELILNLCDKVNDEGEAGARNVVAALLKRLAHRNANVQLYSLALADALVKNCKMDLHREIASRAFTGGVERIIMDRTTHDKVKKRALGLVKEWTHDFKDQPDLGVMEELYETLKSRNYHFEVPDEAPPPPIDDEIRRREEEELQRVLEMSVHDKGGRNTWTGYTAASSPGAGGSGSSHDLNNINTSGSSKAHTTRTSSYAAVTSAGPRSASPSTPIPAFPSGRVSYPTAASTAPGPAPQSALQQPPAGEATFSRVRALHTFEPTQPGELAFEKGDVIKVVDRNYKDWWRGQLRGKTGIFPVNYVEPLPEPSSADIAREAEIEATVYAQAASIDRLLNMLRGLDPAKDNLADNEEIQDLYRSSLSLRPKIVKLLDKYSQKRAELMGMNESFLKARRMFDRMMEESLAVHNPGVSLYDYTQAQAQTRPNYDPRQSVYGWQQSYAGYQGYPADQYPPEGQYAGQQGYPAQPGYPGYDANAYSAGAQQPGYDQYAQNGYQYGQQPPDGRAQYAEGQPAGYGQSPYPQDPRSSQYGEQAPAGQTAGYAQGDDQNAQYPDEHARAWAEYYAAQDRARAQQEGQTPMQAPQPQETQPQQNQAGQHEQPVAYNPQQQQQYPQPQGYQGPQATPAPSMPSQPAPTEPAYQGQGQPQASLGRRDSYSSQFPGPSAAGGQTGYGPPQPQPQRPGGGPPYESRSDQPQPPAPGPPEAARPSSVYQAHPPQPIGSPPPQPGYPAAANGGLPAGAYAPAGPNDYQGQYASMHQDFAGMSVADPAAAPNPPAGP